MPARTLHYTFFFDVTSAPVDAKGRFRYTAVHLGSEAVTTATPPAQDTESPFFSEEVPAGSKLFLSFVETSGQMSGVARCSVVNVTNSFSIGQPLASGLPGLDNPGVVHLSAADPGSPALSGTLNSAGFSLENPVDALVNWQFNPVIFASRIGDLRARIFVLNSPTSIHFKLVPAMPDIVGTIAESDPDTTGVPIP